MIETFYILLGGFLTLAFFGIKREILRWKRAKQNHERLGERLQEFSRSRYL